MIVALIAGLALPPVQGQTLDLFRGAQVQGEGYWAVADTDLDQSAAERSKGGLFTLEGGKSKTILVRFGDLDHLIPKGAVVTNAQLVLSPSSNDLPQFVSIRRVNQQWGEGPSFAATMGRAIEEPKPQWAATWKQRRSGRNGIDWQQAGATGPDDGEVIAGAQFATLEKEVVIKGLGPVVQSIVDHWDENNGFALQFDGKCEFFSSEAKAGRPRLQIEFTTPSPAPGPDLCVQSIVRLPVQSKPGDEVVYRATVANLGTVEAPAFQAMWSFGEKAGSRFSVAKPLAPNQSTTIEYRKTFQAWNEDHRTYPIRFRVFPGASEVNKSNDAAEIFEDGLRIAFTGNGDMGNLQRVIRRMNQVVFENSRFSYARDGVIERLRLTESPDDADYVIDAGGNVSERELMRRIATALTGLAPQTQDSVAVGDRVVAISDPYAGILGMGDTRNDGLIPAGIPMMYVPVANPLFDNFPIEANGLLSGTEVFAINSGIGLKGKSRQGVLWDLPPTVILRATDLTGKPLDGAELGFYQLQGGTIPETPTQTVLTKEGGTVILENRDVQVGIIDKDAPHQLKRNPFGTLATDGSNGTILVKALINGEVEWGSIKAWQLADAFHRGNRAAAILDVRFNAPAGPLDRTVNLAKGRLVTDKASSLPAKLAGLVDEDPATEAVLGSAPGDWVEIDLGRDRPIGEVELLVKDGSMPAKFDIQVYSTGQEAPDTEAWVKDLNFGWSKVNRGRAKGELLSLPYRGPTVRGRFIRIVNRSGGAMTIREVIVTPLKAG